MDVNFRDRSAVLGRRLYPGKSLLHTYIYRYILAYFYIFFTDPGHPRVKISRTYLRIVWKL